MVMLIHIFFFNLTTARPNSPAMSGFHVHVIVMPPSASSPIQTLASAKPIIPLLPLFRPVFQKQEPRTANGFFFFKPNPPYAQEYLV